MHHCHPKTPIETIATPSQRFFLFKGGSKSLPPCFVFFGLAVSQVPASCKSVQTKFSLVSWRTSIQVNKHKYKSSGTL